MSMECMKDRRNSENGQTTAVVHTVWMRTCLASRDVEWGNHHMYVDILDAKRQKEKIKLIIYTHDTYVVLDG